MASYLTREERDGLPAIRTAAGLVHDTPRRVTVTVDDDVSKYRTTSYAHRSDSPLFQPRPPSPGHSRRQLTELQDQVKTFREDLQKKDALIQQLVSMETVPKVTRSATENLRLETLYTGDRQALEATRSENAALQVKNEKLTNKVKEMENEIEIRDVKIKEMKLMVETSHENETRLATMVESLRTQVSDLEGRAGAFQTAAGRSEFTVSALQKENKESQENIVDLESRLRRHLEEKEAAEARLERVERKHAEFVTQISGFLRIESLSGLPPQPDDIIKKLNDMVDENAMLRGKILTLTETLNNTEMESKASRETIMRLVSEVGKEQKFASKYTSELDSLRRDRHYDQDRHYDHGVRKSVHYSPHYDTLEPRHTREHDLMLESRHELEREISILKERLEGSQRTLEATKAELALRDQRLSTLDRDYRESSYSMRTHSEQFGLFREQIASMLLDHGEAGPLTEESLKTRISIIIQQNREMRLKIESMEDRLRTVTEQLETQYELHKTAAHRARQAEADAGEMQQRLRSAEGELAAGDVLRDGFRTDKEKYMRCLQRLGEVMKMDRISVDLGFDLTVDALISRAEQLCRLEADALADKSTHVYNLQRKVKSLKEQLESKDLHIDLLRKKITTLEEKLLGKTSIERERDNESFKIRKLEKLIEKYKLQLQDSRQEATNLKAQLLGASELRVRTMEQRKEIEELVRQVEELERVRKKQAHKIGELKSDMNSTEMSTQEKRVVADNAVQALSSELRTTKNALNAIQTREKTLVDFRNVVARMLGLDMNTLAIPDYEIISRLEKLINAHHSHTFTTMSLEEALADLEDGFISGYEDYRNTVGKMESQNLRRSRDRVKRKAMKARARSMSPVRRRDPRVY